MSRAKVVVAGSLVAVVVLSASVALAQPLSEQQWRKQANSVCKRVNKDLDKVGNELYAGLGKNEKPSAEQLKAFAFQFVPVVEGAVTEIDALAEPGVVKKDVKKFLSAVSEAAASIEADPSILAGNADPFVKANKIAKKLGLKACAGG